VACAQGPLNHCSLPTLVLTGTQGTLSHPVAQEVAYYVEYDHRKCVVVKMSMLVFWVVMSC
jgi:hypothetical protein